MTIAREIAEYAVSLEFNRLPGSVVHAAERSILDTFGCAIGAFRERPVEIARNVASQATSEKGASVIGTGAKTLPELAAFANGTASRYFDFMDAYENKEFSHPSDNIFPVIAVAEAMRKSGRDVILGTVLAYEVQCRLVDAANLWKRGWDHVVYGLVSVSAAASRMLDLDAEKTEQAINIALSSHITMRQVRVGELSMWKAVSFANAARNAVFAASLAQRGMTGPSPIFEGRMGLWSQVTGKFALDVEKFGGNGKSRDFKISHTIFKYYPAENRGQSAIGAALEARKKLESVDEIESIVVGTPEASLRVIADPEKWNPTTRETADHSLPYMVAAALVYGKIDNGSYDEKRFRDSRILGLMKKIKVVENKEFTRIYPRCMPNEIDIRLKNGRLIRERMLYQKGHPRNPMSDRELEAKFRSLTSRYLNDGKISLLLETLWHLKRLKSLGELFDIIGKLG